MNIKPNEDFYPADSYEFTSDMKEWKLKTGCRDPKCQCSGNMVKGTCIEEKGAVMDLTKVFKGLPF